MVEGQQRDAPTPFGTDALSCSQKAGSITAAGVHFPDSTTAAPKALRARNMGAGRKKKAVGALHWDTWPFWVMRGAGAWEGSRWVGRGERRHLAAFVSALGIFWQNAL
jgi:hypothetical protein